MTSAVPRGVTLPAALSTARAVFRRPDLWWVALGALYRLAPRAWWKRRPHLPVPDAALWDFRMVTVYGTVDADPPPADVIAYLEWCRGTAPARSIGWRERPVPNHRLDRSRPG